MNDEFMIHDLTPQLPVRRAAGAGLPLGAECQIPHGRHGELGIELREIAEENRSRRLRLQPEERRRLTTSA